MPDQPQNLAPRLTKRLLAYAAVVGAAAFIGCKGAAAEVVYTPIHKEIYLDYSLDLNGDGIGDFQITTSYLSGFNQLLVSPAIAFNKVAVVGKGCILHHTGAAPLPSGAIIGPDKFWGPKSACMASLFSWYSDGPWVMQTRRYLGFEFVIDGKSHYGWARFDVRELASAAITGYAYETIPGKPIVAGDQGNDEGNTSETSVKPATLGALAAGAPALNSWRKEETKP
jgi:hypothetical protein